MKKILFAFGLASIATLAFSTPSNAQVEKIISAIDKDSRVIKLDYIEQLNDNLKLQVKCVALVMYIEARGSTYEDVISTGHVVQNRVNDSSGYFPKTQCGVVGHQLRKIVLDSNGNKIVKYLPQFQWTKNTLRSLMPIDNKMWEMVLAQARIIVLDDDSYDPTEGALFFYANRISNQIWAKNAENIKIIGAHKYFTLPEFG